MAMVASSSSSSSSSWVVVLFMLSFFSLIRGKALPRGVSPLDSAYFLGIDSVIKCRDGSSSFPLHRLNDDFCDCPDGTDEPGTSACPEGRFYCNHLKKNRSIFSSRVNDGICDCCDGSDEYNGKIKCPNNCREGDSESLESGFTTEALSTRDMSGVMYDTDRLHQHEELGLSIIKGGRKINDLFDLNRDFKEVAVLEISLVVFVFVVLSWWKFCRHKWIYKPQQKRVRVI